MARRSDAAKLPVPQADPADGPADLAERYLRDGRPALAATALIPLLLAQGEAGDKLALLAARLLQHDLSPQRGTGVPDQDLARAVDRLVQLVRLQDAQIAELTTLARGA